MNELLIYTERMTRRLLASLPDGEYSFTDQLDDDGITDKPVRITVKVTITDERASVDFTGSAPQQTGSINAVYAITVSAVYYVFRCLIGLDVPNNCRMPGTESGSSPTWYGGKCPASGCGGGRQRGNVSAYCGCSSGCFGASLPGKNSSRQPGTMNNVWNRGQPGK